MQTFLPYPVFSQSANCLDRQRLGKQRVEVLQLLKALLVPGTGWSNHPAAKMWRGYERALGLYGIYICAEWKRRGYKDTCSNKILFMVRPLEGNVVMPPWLGREDFHAAHRSNLLRKNPDWYKQFGWTELPNLPYIWPVV